MEERPKRAGKPEPKFTREEKPYRGKGRTERTDKPYSGKGRTSSGDRPYRDRNNSSSSDKPYRSRSGSEGYEKPYGNRQSESRDRSDRSDRSSGYKSGHDSEYGNKPYRDRDSREDRSAKPYLRGKFRKSAAPDYKPKKQDGLVRLNKYLSNAGIASRRDADQLIELGLVKVNGKIVTELGHKVDPRVDIVKYDDKSIKPEKLRYVLLNKPKDFITTMEDPEERKTVMWLVKEACKERIYPVGRLDRQTTGLLLFTNDGDLAKRLTHPRHNVQKIYHVETLEKIRGTDLDAIRKGVELEDGFIKADEISLANDDPRQVGIRIHSGKNRIVRRIFEHFNYTVKKLDRVMFAGLTKKDLPRGRFRHLTEQEVNFLKMIR
ncbi:MAG: rRNA pseudouridine synthase [Flavobacteriales bacterium]|nr:rRNA pseudouridine synthase [Flavobacteriales bacterium]